MVKIEKQHSDDGRKAIDAAFLGHASLKHVVVVDADINIDDPLDVEWAIATRVQMDKDLVLKPNELGSSLDPSADPVSRKTCKAGIDATIPSDSQGKDFSKVSIPGESRIKPKDYL